VVGVIAQLWQGNYRLGLSVGAAMALSMTVASFAGVAAPSLFKLVGVDPAIAAGPLVTTGSDILAVATYLLIAITFLG
jgi:magnesium transporter